MLKILRLVAKGERPKDDTALADLLNKVEIDAYGLATDVLRSEISSASPPNSNPGIRKTPVTATTIQSSKGLAADYVFITHFDDRYFIRDNDKSNISDQDVCNFIVALTRARKKVFLISSDPKNTPFFMNWIDQKHVKDMNAQSSKSPA